MMTWQLWRLKPKVMSRASEPPAPRRCAHWIQRASRYCTSVVQQSDQAFCSQHLPDALEATRARSTAAEQQPAENAVGRARYRRLESQHLASRSSPSSNATRSLELPWACAERPVHLDIGCARGRWLLEIGSSISGRWSGAVNHVGVEIRSALVDEANAAANARGVAGSLQYVAADMARPGTRDALLALVAPRLAAVSVLFPDPYKPKAEHRGRTLTASLAAALADALLSGGIVFVCSDVRDVLDDMVSILSAATDRDSGSSAFERLNDDDEAEAALERAYWLRGTRSTARPLPAGRSCGGSGLGRNLWRVPTEREVVCEQPDGAGHHRNVYRAIFVRRAALRRVDEGGARLGVAAALNGKPGSVSGFYNPAMRANRELCVHELSAALAAGPWHACGGDGDTSTSEEGGEGLGSAEHTVRVLDAFTATGALAIRFAVEAGRTAATRHVLPLHVSAADIDARCIDLARTSAELSGLSTTTASAALMATGGIEEAGRPAADGELASLHTRTERLFTDDEYCQASTGLSVERPTKAATSASVRLKLHACAGSRVILRLELSTSESAAAPPASPPVLCLVHADARALLFLEPLPFDYCHLDPFGSCAPYLDAFLARSPHGGLLSLTATDTSALYAHYPAVSRRLYAADLSRADGNWREAAVRVLCAAVATAAARQQRGIHVLHGTSAAHFVHVLVRVKRGAAAADASVSLVRNLTTPDGATLGPMWAGALNAPRFLRRCIAAATAAGARPGATTADTVAAASARALFERSLDDSPALPAFSIPTGHVPPSGLIDALRARGFSAHRSAFDGDGGIVRKRVRTDAPHEVISKAIEAMGFGICARGS